MTAPYQPCDCGERLGRKNRNGRLSVPGSACSRRVRGEPGAGNEKAVRMLLDDRRGAQSGKMS